MAQYTAVRALIIWSTYFIIHVACGYFRQMLDVFLCPNNLKIAVGRNGY